MVRPQSQGTVFPSKNNVKFRGTLSGHLKSWTLEATYLKPLASKTIQALLCYIACLFCGRHFEAVCLEAGIASDQEVKSLATLTLRTVPPLLEQSTLEMLR